MAGKVSVGQASHYPCVTAVYLPRAKGLSYGDKLTASQGTAQFS